MKLGNANDNGRHPRRRPRSRVGLLPQSIVHVDAVLDIKDEKERANVRVLTIEPGQAGKLSIQVVTSVNGAEQRWQQLFERMFREQNLPALNIDIHDFGATPGVVRLRLEQGLEEVGHD